MLICIHVCNATHHITQRGRPPLVRPKEHLILERRKQEELREEANAVVSYNKQFDLKVSRTVNSLDVTQGAHAHQSPN